MSAPDVRPLSDGFLDWWFAPWALGGEPPGFARHAGPLARRHGYRLWCDAAGIPADLPVSFDSGWQAAASADAALLRRAAGLYAAMLAVRTGRQGALAAQPQGERRWCMGIAATQPLQALTEPGPATSLENWGLAELAVALDTEFAGLWPRLRIVLGSGEADFARTAGIATPAAAVRRLRCWRLCFDRAAQTDMKEAA
ncbi:hypothetical protein ACFFTM_08835 [Pseudoduganella plicata]|uniref:Type VI secretion system-associated protein TagF n=1 Tax=Pseudoduganella plicata TaxID=321984 RepID=A0A4P7BC13_9BURK|nr:hypothetical protein [Pseudoduganella plicata]QBQ35417.1 hypothetical protein E1742_03985 [Pseudoduganella plicata]GGZ01575.1 hypothetical protein GCM10007388_39110 [Pseudoduganella plicata]